MDILAILAFSLHIVGRIPMLLMKRTRIPGIVTRDFNKSNEVTMEVNILVPACSIIGGLGLLILMFSNGCRSPMLGILVLVLTIMPRSSSVTHYLITLPLVVGLFFFRNDFI
jgi:hypothetical protein